MGPKGRKQICFSVIFVSLEYPFLLATAQATAAHNTVIRPVAPSSNVYSPLSITPRPRPPTRETVLNLSGAHAKQPRGCLNSSLLHLGGVGGFLVCFVLKGKANANLGFLCPKGAEGEGKVYFHFLKLIMTNGINCPRTQHTTKNAS